jgi:hypothetical protein
VKKREFTVWKTPHVQQGLNPVTEEDFDEILSASAVGPEREYYFVRHLLMIAFMRAGSTFAFSEPGTFKNQAARSDKVCRNVKIFPLTRGRVIAEN